MRSHDVEPNLYQMGENAGYFACTFFVSRITATLVCSLRAE